MYVCSFVFVKILGLKILGQCSTMFLWSWTIHTAVTPSPPTIKYFPINSLKCSTMVIMAPINHVFREWGADTGQQWPWLDTLLTCPGYCHQCVTASALLSLVTGRGDTLSLVEWHETLSDNARCHQPSHVEHQHSSFSIRHREHNLNTCLQSKKQCF